jgi:hypothetical protein
MFILPFCHISGWCASISCGHHKLANKIDGTSTPAVNDRTLQNGIPQITL